MKVVVIGSNGQLGADVARAFQTKSEYDVVSLVHSDLDISELDSVFSVLRPIKPDLLVNTAAMHHVERCEENPKMAFAINALGARNLAQITCELETRLIHVSTDYVFDGHKSAPYTESDVPLPLNVYGNTKLSGEHFVRTLNPSHFVLRTSALYGKHPCRAKGLNFVELMLKLARERSMVRVVDSEFVTPTPTTDLADQIVTLSRSDAYGLYHATAEGSCSWYEFAKEIFAITNTKVQLEIAGPGEFPAKVPRPTYSVLENQALKKEGLNLFRNWGDGLHDYLGTSARSTVLARS